jgi:hypothetical protein
MDRRFANFGNSDNESVLTDAGRAGRYTCLLMVPLKGCTLGCWHDFFSIAACYPRWGV